MHRILYSLRDNGKFVGKYTITQLSEMLNRKPKTLRDAYVYTGRPVDGRYTITAAGYVSTEITPDLLEEWDRCRLMLNPGARRAEGKIIVKSEQ